ncbi:MAG: uracil-DNA glycosylase family protein [Lautropia sp.]
MTRRDETAAASDGQSLSRRRAAWEALEIGPRWLLRLPPVPARPVVATAAEVVPAAEAIPAAKLAPAVMPVPGDIAAAWQQLRAEVADCRKCGLCERRRSTVFGSGPTTARWMLIGEAPGAEEDQTGEPFVGQAGRLLDQMLRAIGLERDRDVFITNVLKCRPPGNRNPEPIEAETCSAYLYRQIALLQPDLLLLLGRFAAQSVLRTETSIGRLRGQVHHYHDGERTIPVVCTYHPAYLLRNLADKQKSWEDLLFARGVAPAARRDTAPHATAAGD